jgi:hypothetical protein
MNASSGLYGSVPTPSPYSYTSSIQQQQPSHPLRSSSIQNREVRILV